MADFWLTEAQKYIHSLGFGFGFGFGFGVTRPPANDRPQAVRLNQLGADNSFADHPKNELRFRKGGVDDAEDAEVILHEYGHAIHLSQNSASPRSRRGRSARASAPTGAVTVGDVVSRAIGVPARTP